MPRIFVQVAHDGIGYGAAPDFHSVKICLTVQRQQTINLLLIHTGGELGLLTVAQSQIAYQ
jgi:hypothetical protein